MSASTYTVTVDKDKPAQRLDRFLADTLPEFSRTRLRALIAGGRVTEKARGPIRDPAHAVRVGERYVIDVPPPVAAAPKPQAIPLTVLYDDDHLMVIDKPAGLVVHPAPGNDDGTLVNAVLAHAAGGLSQIGGVLRPGIVHRLDKDTSGVMVVAKTDLAHRSLTRQFADHQVEKQYLALAWGIPQPPEGRIVAAIGRSRHDRKKMEVVDAGGKPAMTAYALERAFGTTASLLRCIPETGRTHQIRVHLASIGHPIVGDRLYAARTRHRRGAGTALTAFPRQALHAHVIGITHPASQERLTFKSDLPLDFKSLIDLLD